MGRGCVWQDTLEKIEDYSLQSSVPAESLGFACQVAHALEAKLLRTSRLVKTLKIEFRPALSQNEEKGLVMEIKISVTNPLDTENDIVITGGRILRGALGANREVPGFPISNYSAKKIAERLVEQIKQALRAETERYAGVVRNWKKALDELSSEATA